MVAIADKVASKLEEKKGSISEDEVIKTFLPGKDFMGHTLQVQNTITFFSSFHNIFQTVMFKSYLLSMGIANPVTK